jgi:hypothetical protein
MRDEYVAFMDILWERGRTNFHVNETLPDANLVLTLIGYSMSE